MFPSVTHPAPSHHNRFATDAHGGASLEFVLVLPLLFVVMTAYFEVGWHTLRAAMLERGLALAARDIRLGVGPLTHEAVKAKVCEHAVVLADCERDLLLELDELDLAPGADKTPNCIDRTGRIEPKIEFDPGGRNRVMHIRACMIVDPLLPGIGVGLGLALDASGGYQLLADTAFMNEPA